MRLLTLHDVECGLLMTSRPPTTNCTARWPAHLLQDPLVVLIGSLIVANGDHSVSMAVNETPRLVLQGHRGHDNQNYRNFTIIS